MNSFIIEEPIIEYRNTLQEKSFFFAKRIVLCYKAIQKRDNSLQALYQQLLRSGTSIGANISEAKFAASKNDFSNKFQISLKEANESFYWLKLLFETNILEKKEFESLSSDCEEIIKILTSSINTLKTNSN